VKHAQNKEWRDKEDRCKLNVSFVSTQKKNFRSRWKNNIKIDVKGLTGFSWFRIDSNYVSSIFTKGGKLSD